MPRSVAAALIFPRRIEGLADIPYSAAASVAKAMANRFCAISSRVPLASPTEYSPEDRLCGTSIMKPEFRPAGPCASSRASRTTIRSPGRSCVSRRAAERPANPAPMISQSAVTSASSARTGKVRREIASQPDRPVSTGRRLTSLPCHRTVSSTERSDTSIQIVFSSVYWSWAKIDLSRPPKPDSL